MIILGVDFHPEFQQIASVDTDTGEFQGIGRSASRGRRFRHLQDLVKAGIGE